jgi:hypothetical protein
VSGDRERRGADRRYTQDVAIEPREQFAARTPVQAAEERAHQERLRVESLQLEVEQLAEAPAPEWAERKQVLAGKLENLKARLGSRIGETSERAERDRPLCQRRLRQSFLDICVPSGGEWSQVVAQAIPRFWSRGCPRAGRAHAA